MIRIATGVGLPFRDDAVLEALADTGARVRVDVPLGDCTTIRLGGRASILVQPQRLDELVWVLKKSHRLGLELVVLGGGSNLVVVAEHVPATVLHTRRLDWIVPEAGGLRCGAGASLVGAIKRAMSNHLAGLEGLSGIPGTVGGAVYMNAGGRHAEMGEFVRSVTVIERDGGAREIPGTEIDWSYRSANLGDAIVAEVRLTMPFGAPHRLRRRYDEILAEKAASQPLSAWSAGCVFKNPAGASAGRLIDVSGCKGMEVGGAQVSPVHANFIVNTGGGRPGDFRSLMARVQETVHRSHGVRLEPEVVIWS